MGGKYRVLLMRDDDHVRRFRVNPLWFWLILATILTLAMVAAGGAYGAYTLWDKNQKMAQERAGMEKQLKDAEGALESCRNEKKFSPSINPVDQKLLIESINKKKQEPKASIDLVKIMGQVDLEQVAIRNLNFKQVEGSGLRFTFDLDNEKSKKALSGAAEIYLITTDGQSFGADVEKEKLRFNIQRYKTIDITFPLPEGIGMEKLFGLRLVIGLSSGSQVFAKTFQLSEITPKE